jgi:GNAT superfamily N-acetyltransferase
MHFERRRAEYLISTDPALLDAAAVHAFLTRSYWAAGIPLQIVRKSLENCLAFGLYHEAASGARAQAGLARVITDRATFAYLGDVYVLEEHRGKGLSKWLMQCLREHPDLQGLRRWMLLTKDAHELYRQFGFTHPARPERIMEIVVPDIYTRGTSSRTTG